MSIAEGYSRRSFLTGTSATIVMGVAPTTLRAVPAGPGADNLADLSAVEAVAQMSRGDISAEHYARALVARCTAGHALNTFVSFEPERVMQEARRCDSQRRAGVRPGALFGLPIPIKDCVNTRDYPTTAGTPGLRHFRPTDDAPLVKSLRQAGAIVLGKTNMHELGYGWTSNNESFGPVRNPYDATRIPGGSSGGAAASVAAHMAPLGVGADTNGSIRIPAALCGVAGLRPTTGRYPIARTIVDLALFDSVIANDWRPLQARPLRGLRLGVIRDYWYRDLDPELEHVTNSALERLREAGVEIVESEFPQLANLHESITTPVITHDVGPALGSYLKEYRVGLNFEQLVNQASPGVRDDLRQVLAGGTDFVSDGAYEIIVNKKLPELRRLYQDYFSRTGVAAIVFPATAVPALPVGAEGDVSIGNRRISLFTALARNITPTGSAAIPGLVLPAGLTASGLPVGIELDAPAGTDRALLALGMSVTEVLGAVPPPRI